MAFTIAEINRNPGLLGNVTLGYRIYDTCDMLGGAFHAALSLVSGREEQLQLEESCVGSPPVLGIVGADSSTHSIAISSALGLYMVPMVSVLPEPIYHHQLSTSYLCPMSHCVKGGHNFLFLIAVSF